MGTFSLSGGVEVLGFISPTDPLDDYAVIDPLYGIDGLRNVDTISDLNNISTERRRAGMVVGASGGTVYYKLNPGPWSGLTSDWSIFSSGGGGSFTGGSGNCVSELYVEDIFACNTGVTIHSDFTPSTDNVINLGTSLKRFRNINTVSGTSTVWSATTRIYTPELDLGFDSLGNSRIINANNSIIQDDLLLGGTF